MGIKRVGNCYVDIITGKCLLLARVVSQCNAMCKMFIADRAITMGNSSV